MKNKSLLDIFYSYCDGKTEMESKRFSRFCKDYKLTDKKFGINDIDIVFAKVKSGKVKTITFEQFQNAIPEIAKKKGTTPENILNYIISFDLSKPNADSIELNKLTFYPFNNRRKNYDNSISNDENKELKEELKIKEHRINQLIVELENEKNKNDNKLVNMNDIIAINFISTDQKIHYPISCLKTSEFYEIEAKLYKEYPEYKNTNNSFIANGQVVLRFKKMNENGIKNGDTITLITNE